MAEPKGFLVVPIGYRADGTIHALELSNSDYLKVSIEAITPIISVEQSDPNKLRTAIYGYDGANHQPIKTDTSRRVIIDGESPSLLRPIPKTTSFSNLSLAAGSSTNTVLTVPNGETWRLTTFMHRYTGTVAGVQMTSRLNISGTTMPFFSSSAIVSAIPNLVNLNILMEPGTIIETVVAGATLNDDLQCVAFCERVF